MTELYTLTATELAPLIENRQVSPVELMNDIFSRIEKINPIINAYITTIKEKALLIATQSEQDIMNGMYKGPLHGIPIGIKDNYYTKGIQTTSGSEIYRSFKPTYNSTVVEKLLCAGGILTGKLNMHEFGGGLTNTNPAFGKVRNPWKTNHMPGGSSGGSGAALAAGLAPLATGTDTFGSIRVPAAMCGVYGLKPTTGLVSTHGITPLSWSLDHSGPMARSIPDLALLLNYMKGFDSKDPGSIKTPLRDFSENINKGIKGIRIGVPTFFLEGLEPEVNRLFRRAIKSIEDQGGIITEIEIPEMAMSTFANYVITTGEGGTNQLESLQLNPEGLATDVRVFFQTGVITDTPHYIKAQQVRRLLVKAVKKAFEDVDVLVGPTIPITAPPFLENWVEQNLEVIKKCMPFTAPANLTGIPSLSVPIGFSNEGLPVGMQILGNHLSERLLLQVGGSWNS